MPELKEKKQTCENYFLGEIYKNVKMGADSIINLLPSVKADGLRGGMTLQLDGSEKYAARAANALEERGVKPKEENLFTRLSARMGMAVNTMLDSTTGHIAEMMIKGRRFKRIATGCSPQTRPATKQPMGTVTIPQSRPKKSSLCCSFFTSPKEKGMVKEITQPIIEDTTKAL